MTLHTLWKAFVNLITAPFRFVRWIYRRIAGFFQRINRFFNEDVEDAPLPDAVAKTLESPGDILPHLNALRMHLTRAVLAIIIATAIAFAFNQQILVLLARPLDGGLDSLVAIEVTEPIGTIMRISLLIGFAIAFPYVAFEVWAFIAPGLSPGPRKASLIAIPVATLFFLGGMAFAYFVMLPAALKFLLEFGDFATNLRVSSYVRFVTSIMFWVGLAFEFPLVIFLLALLGWVKSDILIKQWRLAVVIIAVVAALITPTIDPVNMALVMGPLIILYFFSIALAKLAEGRRALREQVEAT